MVNLLTCPVTISLSKKCSILLLDLESYLSPDTETILNTIQIAHLMN